MTSRDANRYVAGRRKARTGRQRVAGRQAKELRDGLWMQRRAAKCVLVLERIGPVARACRRVRTAEYITSYDGWVMTLNPLILLLLCFTGCALNPIYVARWYLVLVYLWYTHNAAYILVNRSNTEMMDAPCVKGKRCVV